MKMDVNITKMMWFNTPTSQQSAVNVVGIDYTRKTKIAYFDIQHPTDQNVPNQQVTINYLPASCYY